MGAGPHALGPSSANFLDVAGNWSEAEQLGLELVCVGFVGIVGSRLTCGPRSQLEVDPV